ncbi:E3 ubiquitin-protein ligase RNF26-like [Brachionichthys hirsutus]|uniref:E3 ubiquitin-protein ligase RNF26-like n=1 Tax=Brachionichthys hirsutus TaxID=412623 RepID=UPI0036044B23
MGLLNLVISSVGKCLDAVCFMLDVNFLIVHTVVRTILAAMAFISSLPTLFLNSLMDLVDLVVFGLTSVAETTSNVAHGTAAALWRLLLFLEGLLESLKMVGYLSSHVVLRSKEQLCRCFLSTLEGCSIAASLVVYLTNTVINFALIAAQNIYAEVAGVCQLVSSPLQTLLELVFTSCTFLCSSLAGTSSFLWSPCELLLDFAVSLVQMFISVFILNTNGLVLTVAIALITTAYLNPEQTRAIAVRLVHHVNSFPALRRLYLVLLDLASTLWGAPQVMRGVVQSLPRILHQLHLLERGLLQQLSQLSSQLAGRTRFHRVHGDGDPGQERRDPPDGRAGDVAHQELAPLSTRQLKESAPSTSSSSSGKVGKAMPAEDLLQLLKEQEDRKKCVICQDSSKTVVLLPCRHLCLCRGCTNILLRQPVYQQNCPLCRHMIFSTMDVYL